MSLRKEYEGLTLALQHIKDHPDPNNGICFSVREHATVEAFDLWLDVRRGLFESWPLYSGDPIYPVPGYPSAGEAYNHCRHYWEGEYGDMRRDLLDFLIQECAARALDPR